MLQTGFAMQKSWSCALLLCWIREVLPQERQRQTRPLGPSPELCKGGTAPLALQEFRPWWLFQTLCSSILICCRVVWIHSRSCPSSHAHFICELPSSTSKKIFLHHNTPVYMFFKVILKKFLKVLLTHVL